MLIVMNLRLPDFMIKNGGKEVIRMELNKWYKKTLEMPVKKIVVYRRDCQNDCMNESKNSKCCNCGSHDSGDDESETPTMYAVQSKHEKVKLWHCLCPKCFEQAKKEIENLEWKDLEEFER